MQPAKISKTQLRDKSYDILKGMLILIVVLGHSCQLQYNPQDLFGLWHDDLFNAIYSFHMPLFIMLSGYFFLTSLQKPFCDFFNGKSRRLLLPWFIWSTLLVIIDKLLKRILGNKSFILGV